MKTKTFEPERVLTTEEKSALRGELFLNQELVEVDLSAADLRGARFERTILMRCSLAGADLRGAQFFHCELQAVDLSSALLSDTRFDGSTFDDLVTMTPEDRAHVERAGGSFAPPRASLR